MISNSVKQTHKIAENLAQKITDLRCCLNSAVVVALVGDLGSGKTTFTQGFAKALGVKERITSPTFVILKRFSAKGGSAVRLSSPSKSSGRKNLIHVDAYRMEKPKEILDLRWEEMAVNPRNIILVEWAERIKKVLKKPYFLVNFEHKSEKSRSIDISLVK